MSVVSMDFGWLVDTPRLISQQYKICHFLDNDLSSEQCYACNKDLYAIHQPFRMDTQFVKIVKEAEESASVSTTPEHRKKRKRKYDRNPGEIAADKYHTEISNILVPAVAGLVEEGFKVGYFTEKPKIPEDNNTVARKAAQLAGPDQFKNSDLFNRLVIHDKGQASVISYLDSQYIIPAKSRFLMSDISNIKPLEEDGTKYDVIVIDPPWENKSVKRKKKYKTLSDWDLYKLPVPSLAAENCLIVVWVTNKQRQRNFVKGSLFKAWSVEMVAEWHWVKVTKHGETIFPMDSPHKKPYETIIIGRICRDPHNSCHAESVPNNKVLVSIPCCIHSQKPPLGELLKPYLPENPKCLEMFARNLSSGWTSWGNEVLRFQHMDFFVPAESAESH